MTIELNFSVVNTDDLPALPAVLDTFEAETGVHINLIPLNWSIAWDEVSKYAASEKGPDISEIGSTWMASLASMNALPAFLDGEIEQWGGSDLFYPGIWKTAHSNGRVYGMPWICDSRLIYYRRDFLEKVNISPDFAFASPDNFYTTLETMQQAGMTNIWAVPTWRRANNVHTIASWVWAYGGDFLSSDGKKIILDQPQALHGMARYFETVRFMSLEHVAGIPDQDLVHLYTSGKLAMFPSGPWVAHNDIKHAAPEVVENWGVSTLFNRSFIGGTHLAIWRYSRKRELAMQFLSYLSSSKAQEQLFGERFYLLSANQKLIQPNQNLKHRVEMLKAIQTGRSFSILPLWSKLEERLVAELNGIWADVLALPVNECSYEAIRKIVDSRMIPSVRRLNLAFFG